MPSTGYLRLSQAQLQDTDLVHLISGLDEDQPDTSPEAAIATAITGYTEWVSEAPPVLTIGWDWQMLSGAQGATLQRASGPRSNVMLLTAGQADAGPGPTEATLALLVDGFDWQTETLRYINTRYHC